MQDGTAHWQRADRKDLSGQIHRPLRRQGILYEEILRVAPWGTLRRCRQENSFSEIGESLHTNLSLHVETNKRLTFYFLNSFAISFDRKECMAWRFPLKKRLIISSMKLKFSKISGCWAYEKIRIVRSFNFFFLPQFPIFVDLCSDKVWGVRKACVDVMMPVSCCMTLQHRRLLLAELLATHLNDESKWVRMSAFQILGPFISTFAKQFTEVTYNQHGELVFTSQQDNRFRYKKLKVFTFYLVDSVHRLAL